MARCGCSPTCNCTMKAGTCTTVTGSGSTGDPYIVGVVVDNQTIFCGAGGLEARLNTIDTNTVDLEGNGTVATPLEAHVIRTPDGNVPDPDALGTGNLVKEVAGPGGGIYVSCEDVQDCVGAAIDAVTSDCLAYDDANNTISILICGEPNGVECASAGDPNCGAGGLLVFPSSDADNSLTFGTDNRLFAPAAVIAAGECMTFTGAGTQADPFVITPLVAPELNGLECVPGQGLLVTPSSDAGNFLTFGGDTRLFVNRCPLTLAGSQVLIGNTGPCFELIGGTDCVTPMLATLRLSNDPCQGLTCGNDGLYVQVDQTNLPNTVAFDQNFGPFGPFNGFIPLTPGNGGAGLVLLGPICLTITNPSPCRDMIMTGLLTGFAETGRTTGRFRLGFEVAEGGNPAGPWFTISQMGQSNPNPASRVTSNATWTGGDFLVSAGTSRSECFRLIYNANNPALPVVNGRVFSGSIQFSIQAKWRQ